MTIQQLVDELHSQQLQKKDMIVPTSCLGMRDGKMVINNVQDNTELFKILQGTGISVGNEGNEVVLDINDTCHDQIAGKLSIPRLYYDRLRATENIPCLDANVNHWLRAKDENVFVRTFINKEKQTGLMRALLSDRFKVIDNYDVLMAALEAIRQSGVEIKIHGADITDKKMYVRFEAPNVVKNSPALLSNYRVPPMGGGGHQFGGSGDTGVVAGFVLTNSETGNGTFTISPRLIIRACTNGAVVTKDAYRRTHLGGKMEQFSEIDWSKETHEKNLELIISQTKDAVKTFISEDYLGRVITHLESEGTKPLQHPMDAVKNVSRELSFSEEKEKTILDYFIKGADTTPFGIAQAVTFYAHVNADADEQHDMEKQVLAIVENSDRYDKPVVERQRKTGNKSFLQN